MALSENQLPPPESPQDPADSVEKHGQEGAHFIGAAPDLFQDVEGGRLGDERDQRRNHVDWDFDYLFNGDDEDLALPSSQLSLLDDLHPND